MTRLLGIDLGERRIGLALADDDGSAARPHCHPAARPRSSTPTPPPWPPSSKRWASTPWSSACRSRRRATRARRHASRATGERRSAIGSISGHVPRRALEQPPRRGSARTDETRTFRAVRRARPSAMPTVRGSTARPPRSSSRMSSTHERGSVRPCARTPTTPRRPTDDDPLRRTPAGRPRPRQARPYDPDAYATETIPEYLRAGPRSRGGGGGGRGVGGGWSGSSSSSSSRSSWRRSSSPSR